MNELAESLGATLDGSANLRAFLRVIRHGETSQEPRAYQTIVGGGFAPDNDAHPRRRVYIDSLNLWSTAAGAYQFLSRTWDGCARALELTDFSPRSQDIAAVYLIRGRKALDDVLNGRVHDAIRKCALEWASLPGSPYGQPVVSLQKALEVYAAWGGSESPAATAAPAVPEVTPTTTTEDRPMLPASVLVPIGIELAKLLPSFAKILKPDSERAQINAEVLAKGVEVITTAVGARNPAEALEVIRENPEQQAAADDAVKFHALSIIEAGGGGIAGAREFLMAASQGAYGGMVWKIVAGITASAVGFLLLANLMAGSMMAFAIYRGEASVVASAMQFFAQVITADIGAALTAFGFWLGSSWGSKRQEESSHTKPPAR